MAPYKVKSISYSNVPFTVGRAKTSNDAVRLARKHTAITRQRCQIFLRGKVMAY